ncbi:hypothetical protein IEQ34_017354 [Dendrobium chrysotoxum]|uniref:Disease resistance protein winged helix domain-containing protein n=1 Tax=Dendrobium chrysotoxum TaxID=161865 RepID=A0AAV7FTN0_DENCH|nr:hypothetical protein IEQ34_017354 [Dendrobium chrysotoxum]
MPKPSRIVPHLRSDTEEDDVTPVESKKACQPLVKRKKKTECFTRLFFCDFETVLWVSFNPLYIRGDTMEDIGRSYSDVLVKNSFFGKFESKRIVCYKMHDLPYELVQSISIQESFRVVGAEVAVLCITKSKEVLNYQAFTNSKGIYKVAETMPESDRWDSCLARPISSFHQQCTRRGDTYSGLKFTYNQPSGNSHAVKTFLYKPASAPAYCI